MPRRGENIYHRKDGRWEGRYIKEIDPYSEKKRWGSVYGRDYAECRQKLQMAKVGLLPAAPRERTLTLGEWLEKWLTLNSGELRPSTYVSYHNLIERHIKPKLGVVKLSRMTDSMIREFLEQELQLGRLDGEGGLARSTVQMMAHILRSATDEAKKRQLMGDIVISGLSRGKRSEREVSVYSLEEQNRLTRHAEELCMVKPAYMSILLALDTGIRIGEICALRWKDISLKEGLLYVNGTLQRIPQHRGKEDAPKTKIIIGPPKSVHSLRCIPISERLLSRLQLYYDTLQSGYRQEDSFVFQHKGNHLEPRAIQRLLDQVITAAGVPRLKFHALRHTFATRAVEAGLDVKTLSEILGHSNVQITLNTYVHSNLEQKRYGIERVQKYVSLGTHIRPA